MIGDQLDLTAGSAVAGGNTLSRTDLGVIFLSGALPGERVQAVITEEKKSFRRARVTAVLEPSPHRVPDRREEWGCPGIGGVEYAHADLAYSRELKRQAVADQLSRIGGLEVDVPMIVPVHDTLQWRTRVQLAVAGGQVGMMRAGTHEVVPVTQVPLAVPQITALGLDRLALPGATRVEIAVGDSGGALTVAGDRAAASAIAEVVPPGWSCSLRAGGSAGGRARVLTGTGRVDHVVRGVRFEVAGDGFWQVHPDAAGMLSAAVGELVRGRVLDLYCGAGLHSIMAAAEHGVSVHGIESSAQAIRDAKGNAARLSGSTPEATSTFEVGRVEKLGALPVSETVVVDPPRAGLGRQVVDLITASGADRLVYVSCDGGTFARDAAQLVERGFRLQNVRVFDLFPLTAHVELLGCFGHNL